MSTHRTATFGRMLLVTLAMGTNAQQVETVPCPLVKPSVGDACLPFDNSFCPYGEVCCPGDSTTAEICVPETTCYCEGSVSCDPDVPLPCPSLCPVEPPNTNDACNLSSLFSCRYGDAFVCDEDDGPAYQYEKECVCNGDHFYCTTNVCPVECPATKPVEGATCTPFIDYSCEYGEFCCPDGGDDAGTCVTGAKCYCDERTMTIACHEPPVVCPSLCPASKPNEGDNNSGVCNALGERYQCVYDLVVGCPPDQWDKNGDGAKDFCSCTASGAVSCHNNCMGFDMIKDVGEHAIGGRPNQDHNETKKKKKKKDKKKKTMKKKKDKKKIKSKKLSKTVKKAGKARKLLRSPKLHKGDQVKE